MCLCVRERERGREGICLEMCKHERAVRESFDGFVEIRMSVFRNPAVKSSAVWFSGAEYMESKELSTRLAGLVVGAVLAPQGSSLNLIAL